MVHQVPTQASFASVNYVSDNINEDENNGEPPPLLSRSDSSSTSSGEDEDQATNTTHSNNKVAHAMKKLSETSYSAMPGKLLQADTFRPTRSSSRLGRNQNVKKFAHLVADFQGMNKEISEIGPKYKEPNIFLGSMEPSRSHSEKIVAGGHY